MQRVEMTNDVMFFFAMTAARECGCGDAILAAGDEIRNFEREHKCKRQFSKTGRGYFVFENDEDATAFAMAVTVYNSGYSRKVVTGSEE